MAHGKRVRWWEDYRESVPVVVGHYWRTWDHLNPPPGRQKRADFGGKDHRRQWMGRRAESTASTSAWGSASRPARDTGLDQSRLAALWDEGPPRW